MARSIGQIFAAPGDDYYPVPWWAWSGKLEPDLMRRQLALMHEQGIREFFIFPIYGMEPEYMSEDYLDRIALTVDWCREHWMNVWIYDELSWPSGTAAGLVARRHPSAVASNIMLTNHTRDSLPELGSDPSVLHVYRSEGADEVAVYRRVRDVTANLTVRGCLWTQNDPGMLDLLSASAGAAFIEEAYEPIARRFPDDLGKTIKGFFTDEPSIAPGSIAWTDDLPRRFKERYGYDLVPLLHDLNYESLTSERTRMHYWQLVSEMISEAFTGQIARWCEDRGLLLTGHMVHEENSCSVWYHGDSPMHQMKMHVPGCDLLQTPTNFTEPHAWYVYGANSLVKVPKDPASAARFAGRDRVMCEAYGVLPWTKTMTDEKRLTDWLVALGVNLINDNSLISDISGFRKRGISGKHFTQPWWPYAHLYYDCAARICELSAETTLDTELLVLYPSTTWWSMVVRARDISPELRRLEVALDNTLDALVRTHWDFEMLFEDVLAAAKVENGALLTTGGTFRAIIAAGITRLRPEAAARLEEFAASGGTVLLVDSEVEAMEESGRKPLALPGAVVLSNETASFRDSLDSALADRLHKPWSIEGPESHNAITSARADGEGNKFLFVANMTPGDKELRICWRGGDPIELWDADSGARWSPLQVRGQCPLMLPDGQSVWAAQVSDQSADTTPLAHFQSVCDRQPVLELDGPLLHRIDRQNLYRLAPRLLPDTDGHIEFGAPELDSDDGWITLNEDDAGIPLGPDSMARYWLRAEFDLVESVGELQLVGDSEDVERAYLNGVDLGESRQETVWDYENRVWEVGDSARIGRNVAYLRVKASPYNSERIAVFPRGIVEPMALRGWFAVDAESGAVKAVPESLPLGNVRELGFPHFAGTCIYEETFMWNGPDGPALISIDTGRDVAEVQIDGISLGHRSWGRRSFRVERLRPGLHSISIRATNTLGGFLTRYYNAAINTDIPPSGLLSPIRIYTLTRED